MLQNSERVLNSVSGVIVIPNTAHGVSFNRVGNAPRVFPNKRGPVGTRLNDAQRPALLSTQWLIRLQKIRQYDQKRKRPTKNMITF